MLKMRQKAQAQGVNEASSSKGSPSNRLQKIVTVSKKRLVLAGICLAVIIAVVAGLMVKNARQSTTDTPYFMTEAQADAKKLEKLKASAPPATASVDKQATYLTTLIHAAAATGDYKTAVSAFDRRISIKTSDLTYEDYLDIAGYYYKMQDKTNAARMLDKALEVLPRQDNPNELYYYQAEVTRITNLRTEFTK
jgi:tetratricopeptide (TPR) repeat protein